MPMPIYVEEIKAAETDCQMTFGVQETERQHAGPYGCKGKRCMAWRFARTNIWVNGEAVTSDDTYGFCGLAGVPGQSSL